MQPEIPDMSKYPALDEFANKRKNKYILDENRNVIPASLMEWAEFLEKGKDIVVKQETIGDKRISTVFIGLDHNLLPGGKHHEPHIFETMIFQGEDYGHHTYLERYPTWKDAEKGHEKAVQWVKDGCKDEVIFDE